MSAPAPRTAEPALPQWVVTANVAGAVLTLVLLVGRVVINHWHNYGWWSYSAGEWLINYGAGFLRRGAGQVFLDVPAPSAIVALEVWLLVEWTVISVLLALLVHRVMTRTGTAWALGAWVVPSWFIISTLQLAWKPIGITNVQFPTRKEQYFLMVILIAVTWWQSRVSWPSVVAISALLVVGVLFHEGFAPPTTVALLVVGWWATRNSPARSWLARGAVLVLPALVVAAAVVSHPGTAADRLPVWDAVDSTTRDWYLRGDLPPLTDDIPGAIAYLGTTASDGWRQVDALFINVGAWRWWLLNAVIALGAVVLVILACDRSPGAVRRILVPLLLVAIALLPLFLIAIDWGRWVAFLANLVLVLGLAGVLRARDPVPLVPRPGTVTLVVAGLVFAALYGLPEIGDVSWGAFLRWPG